VVPRPPRWRDLVVVVLLVVTAVVGGVFFFFVKDFQRRLLTEAT